MSIVLGPVEVTYRLGDLLAVNFRAWRSYVRALVVGTITAMVVIIFLRLLLERVPLREAVRIPGWPFVIGACASFLLLWFSLCPFLGYWRSRRRSTLGPNAFSFEEDGIRVQSRRAESLVYWSALKRVVRSRSRLFLFITPGTAFIIPRRCFSGEDEFRDWAERAKSMYEAAKASNDLTVE